MDRALRETFVRVWQNYGGFRAEASEKTWLTTVLAAGPAIIARADHRLTGHCV